ncbi:hypothetical protein [Spiroplasma clarkii]|uniref:hypothetical protein n=1 Tax=Spiroplasma clarkii TaxID=2139 RepID=UPI001475AA77|nr:hypothetical protein [Spiroplasma clarkii]
MGLNLIWQTTNTLTVANVHNFWSQMTRAWFIYIIFANNFYLLFVGIFMSKNLFFSSYTRHLMAIERRLGYSLNVMFWPRFLNIVSVIVVTNLVLASIGGLTLINSGELTQLVFTKTTLPYLVIILTSLVLISFGLLIYSFFKFTLATWTTALFCVALLIIVNVTAVRSEFKDGNISYSLHQIEKGNEFYQAANASGLDEIFNAENFIKTSQKYLLGEESSYQFQSINEAYNSFLLKSKEQFLHFYKAGQVLNLTMIYEETTLEKPILETLNPELFAFFEELHLNLTDYQSKFTFENTPFSSTQLKKVEIMDLQPILNHLQTKTSFWSKYQKLFEVLTQNIKLNFIFDANWVNANNTYVLEDGGISTRLMNLFEVNPTFLQTKIDDFYKQVPEFMVLAQTFMSNWKNCMENGIILNNIEATSFDEITFIDEVELTKKLNSMKLATVFNVSTFWSLLNSTSSWTNIYLPVFADPYTFTSKAWDYTGFEKIYDKDNYPDKIYQESYLKDAKLKEVNWRNTALIIVYVQIIAYGLIMLGGCWWKFRKAY